MKVWSILATSGNCWHPIRQSELHLEKIHPECEEIKEVQQEESGQVIPTRFIIFQMLQHFTFKWLVTRQGSANLC